MKNHLMIVPMLVVLATACARDGGAARKSFRDCTSDCHAALGKAIASAKNQHEPVAAGACLSCHEEHGTSTTPRLLSLPLPDLCFSCHREFGARIRSAQYLHTPVREGRCTECHGPHGSDGVKLLVKWRPLSDIDWMVYGGSTDIKFCTECHGREFIVEKETSEVTAFRDGTVNLHALHVLQKKGRACKSCHDTHGAGQPFHLRRSVPFGTAGWELPLSFTKTETGGTCVVGCHETKSYDREHRLP